MFCELKMKWEFLNRLKHLICVCTYTCECGGPSTTLGSCLFPHYLWIELRPSGLAARTTLPAEPFCWPQFLFFYFQTWSTMWTWWHTPQSQPLGRQRQENSLESKKLRKVWIISLDCLKTITTKKADLECQVCVPEIPQSTVPP